MAIIPEPQNKACGYIIVTSAARLASLPKDSSINRATTYCIVSDPSGIRPQDDKAKAPWLCALSSRTVCLDRRCCAIKLLFGKLRLVSEDAPLLGYSVYSE